MDQKKIGAFISELRKEKRMTQKDLAEKLGVTDRAISKWENGRGLPEVSLMKPLCEILEITVNELLADPNELPPDGSKMEKTMEIVVQKALKRKANKQTILGLSSILVWFVALLLYVVISTIGIPNSWLAFFFAIPADCIVMLSLRSAWHDFRWNRALISGIMWGTLISIFATVLVFWQINIWKIFLLGIPGQAAILLWFKLFRAAPEEDKK